MNKYYKLTIVVESLQDGSLTTTVLRTTARDKRQAESKFWKGDYETLVPGTHGGKVVSMDIQRETPVGA